MVDDYDVIVVGSGAGGGAAAYRLVKAGKRVLVLEKGGYLPLDGSTLDVKRVFVEHEFTDKVEWIDGLNQRVIPGEYYNVGGKTKWYGAVLHRFTADEFEPDPAFKCLGWPFGLDTMVPFYEEAETLLAVHRFDNEPELQALVDRVVKHDPRWKPHPLPLGLKPEILQDPKEAKHFDGFASVSGFKSDSQRNLINLVKDDPRFTILTDKPVANLISAEGHPERIVGVRTTDGSTYRAPTVVLAAGAMSSPRILQDYLAETGFALPCAPMVGANFKFHLSTAILAVAPWKDHDVLRKTAIFFHESFPHSDMQCLGWMDAEMIKAQLPAAVPTFVDKMVGSHAVAFWATTEDGSVPENRIISGGKEGTPVMDYRLDRIPDSLDEHHAMVEAFERALLSSELVSASRYMGPGGTSHACGSMVTGTDPVNTVVDPDGKVHGMEGLYVGDGSALPRSSRVNPSLTIYSWGLRLGHHLGSLSST